MLELLNRIKELFNPAQTKKTDEDKTKELELQMERASKLKKLISSDEWKEFEYIVNNVIDKMQASKLVTRLDVADDDTVQKLKYKDREIFALQTALALPANYIEQIRQKEEKAKK